MIFIPTIVFFCVLKMISGVRTYILIKYITRDVGRSEILGGRHVIVAIQGPKFWGGAQQYYSSTKFSKSGGARVPPAPPVPTAL